MVYTINSIANSFDVCRLNPDSDDLSAFYEHLDNTEEYECYATMIEKELLLIKIERRPNIICWQSYATTFVSNKMQNLKT